MEWNLIAPYIFGFMALAIASWIGKSIGDMGASMNEIKNSVGELNVHVAVVIEKVENHDKRIERLEESER